MGVVGDTSRDFRALTKSDTQELPHDSLGQPPRALYIGTGGDVVVVNGDEPNETAVTFKNVASGTILPIRASLLKNATTAADIVALY